MRDWHTELLQLTEAQFEDTALRIFNYQRRENPIYRRFLELLGKTETKIQALEEIPFMPISFFKNHNIMTGTWTPVEHFQSSGTTGQTRSQHPLRNAHFYKQNAQRAFEKQYGPLDDFVVFALLPSYLQRKGASLVFMAEHFIHCSRHPESGFFLNDTEALIHRLNQARLKKQKVLLLGVTFALLELAEHTALDLNHCIIMETGGMKGRREELTREALHQKLCTQFNVTQIHSEYGMTELLSQAYAPKNGRFIPAPTLRVRMREITDPLQLLPFGKTGGINIIDLANVDTCSFIATDDLGRVYADETFEVLGRFDAAELRGCNLMWEDVQ